MSKINVCFMTDACLETLRSNSKTVVEYMKNNKVNSSWISKIYPGDIYEVKKYKIEKPELELSKDGKYSTVDLKNSIKIHEALKELPRYILTDERFWAWFNFEIAYQAASQAMKIRSESTFKQHWLFNGGNRRGIFFGVMSRCYFRVALSEDDRLSDKYELTKFVIENPERFRNLSWRANSSEKHVVLGALKAEKSVCDYLHSKVKNEVYPILAKYISNYASIRLIDVISEEEIYRITFDKMMELVNSTQ